jgi:purine-binding chemotaxis protein CheW
VDQQILIIKLNNEDFGIEFAVVESLIKTQAIAKPPDSPGFIDGFINLHWTTLPVIDLRKRFGYDVVQATPDTRIVVVMLSEIKVGVIVDSVSGVFQISNGDNPPASTMVTNPTRDYLQGITRIRDQSIILIDLAKLLTISEKRELAKVDLYYSPFL